jgi:arginase
MEKQYATDKIIDFSKQLSMEVLNVISSGSFPVVIGGDCSILIGCALGLKAAGIYGLFFIDGHADFVLPPSSQTKGAAGMDLAIATGYGHNRLTNINGLKPYIYQHDVTAFGNRDTATEYTRPIQRSSIGYFDLTRIREIGIEPIVNSFLKRMKAENTDGFWIHLDVDVLDDNLMPCVDSRQPGGLTYEELALTMKLLLLSGHCSDRHHHP